MIRRVTALAATSSPTPSPGRGRRRRARRAARGRRAADVGEHLGAHGRGRARRHPPLRLHPPGLRRVALVGHRGPRVPPEAAVTVDEVVLVPGAEAIVAPAWVPYKERIQPGDLSPGDLLPVEEDDPRLVPTYSFGDDPLDADDQGAGAPGRPGPRPRPGAHALPGGRRHGRPALVRRRRRPRGRRSPRALPSRARTAASWCASPARCPSTFGVCANGNANDDGRVVSFDHGCGAHSEVKLAQQAPADPGARTTSSTR